MLLILRPFALHIMERYPDHNLLAWQTC